MIAYKIEIVIDEEHEERFDDILKNIYDHIERIDGIDEVKGIPESYFEYNEDINYEEEEDDRTDQEIVDIIKASKTAKFSFPMMGCQKLPIERIRFLLDAWEKNKAKPVLVINRTNSHYNPKVYACYCGKQQKDTFKNRKHGCFCERCGQKLVWEERNDTYIKNPKNVSQ